jgi:hypothetical protein
MTDLIETKYRIIHPGDSMELAYSESRVKKVMWPRRPGFKLIRELVEPLLGEKKNMEHVSVWEDFDYGEKFYRLDMFVDEVGLIDGRSRNEVATTAYRRANQMGLSSAPKAFDAEDLSFIAGPAVLFSRRIWF